VLKKVFLLALLFLLGGLLLSCTQSAQEISTTTTSTSSSSSTSSSTIATTTTTTSTSTTSPLITATTTSSTTTTYNASYHALDLTAEACTWARSGSNTNQSSQSTVYLGGDPSWFYAYAYLKFDISSIPALASIYSATFYYYVDSGNVMYFQIMNLASSWEESTLTFSNKPTAGTTIASGTVQYLGYNSIDITNGFRNWFNGTSTNNGFGMYGIGDSQPLVLFEDQHNTNPPIIRAIYIL